MSMIEKTLDDIIKEGKAKGRGRDKKKTGGATKRSRSQS
eukprot:gene15509-14557_t